MPYRYLFMDLLSYCDHLRKWAAIIIINNWRYAHTLGHALSTVILYLTKRTLSKIKTVLKWILQLYTPTAAVILNLMLVKDSTDIRESFQANLLYLISTFKQSKHWTSLKEDPPFRKARNSKPALTIDIYQREEIHRTG